MTTKICGAKTRSGKPCQKSPIDGRERCRLHGGLTPRGPASPHWVDGRRSKDLPSRLQARYQEALADSELLALNADIALIDARIGDMLTRVDSGESGKLWSDLKTAYKAFVAARVAGEVREMGVALAELERLINRGHSDYVAWREIGMMLEQRRRLVETERKRLADAEQIVTVKELIAYTAAVSNALQEAVSRHVADPDTRRLVFVETAEAIRRILTRDAD